jgi:hypothetical protein
MPLQDRISLHRDRAQEEIERARAAACPAAARAHLGLCELHLGRMRELEREARQACRPVAA